MPCLLHLELRMHENDVNDANNELVNSIRKLYEIAHFNDYTVCGLSFSLPHFLCMVMRWFALASVDVTKIKNQMGNRFTLAILWMPNKTRITRIYLANASFFSHAIRIPTFSLVLEWVDAVSVNLIFIVYTAQQYHFDTKVLIAPGNMLYSDPIAHIEPVCNPTKYMHFTLYI